MAFPDLSLERLTVPLPQAATMLGMKPRLVSGLIHEGLLTAACGEGPALVTLASIKACLDRSRISRPLCEARS
ncbi:hypothetical protein [Streptomyces lydicus]|uniref:hypothetical protein n=1 Tax=Streptomyces lydicus TaxID=47763 RepID=UPI001013687E|nr:hypothetical protein [Streptomyces lydicus]MCZ1012232.1 hypothetical protein [Streptomyces lydicus]